MTAVHSEVEKGWLFGGGGLEFFFFFLRGGGIKLFIPEKIYTETRVAVLEAAC